MTDIEGTTRYEVEEPVATTGFWRRALAGWLRADSSWTLIAALIVAIVLAVTNPDFATVSNLTNVLLQSCVVAFMALGQTFVIIGGGIDLSMAGVLALSGVLGADTLVRGEVIFIGILLMLAVGTAFGSFNGIAVAKVKMTPFIVTLSTLVLTTGIAAMYTQGVTIGPVMKDFRRMGSASGFAIPIPVLLVAAAAVLAYFLLQRTAYGRMLYATGTNALAARSSGIPTEKIIFSTYLIGGLAAAMAGMTLVARLGTGSSGMGGDLLILDAISAVIIGGASLKGGRGTIMGTLAGVLLISLISNGLNLFGVSYFLTIIVKGVVIFLAVLLDAWRTRAVFGSAEA
jgi:ribose/xylose/arabinose/galactoside ABC-type transport system permease subunit